MPSVNHLSRFILDDAIIDTIHIFNLNHTECSRLLLNVANYYNQDYLESEGYIVYESVVEAIFSQVVTLPHTLERSVYYTTLLMDLCRESLDKIPGILGRCLRTLYARIDLGRGGMDIQVINRISELFSHHLSNFGFSWRWSDWDDVVSAKEGSGKLVFVRETLERCIRLAYYDRIKNTIPDAFLDQPHVFPVSAPGFTFTYLNESTCSDATLVGHAAELNRHILGRHEAHIIQEKLASIEAHFAAQDPMADPTQGSRDVLMQCVMYQGSKSFSHVLNVIEKYLGLLQSVNESPEARQHTVQIVCAFWQGNTQFLEIILDKLVNYRIVDPKAILAYLISSAALEKDFSRFYVSNIIKNTLIKINLKAEQIEIKLKQAKAKEHDDMGYSINVDESEHNVHTLQAAYDAVIKEKKDTLIAVFQNFVNVLAQKDLDQVYGTPLWRYISGLLREIGRYVSFIHLVQY